jgi:hypothetical protein
MRPEPRGARAAVAALLLGAVRDAGSLEGRPEGEWDLFVRVARRTRLLARLAVDLEAAGLRDCIPSRALTHLTSASVYVDHHQRLVRWEVDRVLWALEGMDVPLVLLKGAAYLLSGLPAARGRISVDLDVLVPQAEVSRVEGRLRERGWASVPFSEYDERYYRTWMHEVPALRHRERSTEVDLHHTILARTSRFPVDGGLLLAASNPLSHAGLGVLSPADMVLHATVHLLLEGDPQEGLRLRDLVDIHDLLLHFGRESEFWGELLTRARALGLTRPLHYALRYSARLLATPVPIDVLARTRIAGPPAPVLALMDRLVPQALLPDHPDHPTRRTALARWLLYVRAHWLRMPPLLLAAHLARKGVVRLRPRTGGGPGPAVPPR